MWVMDDVARKRTSPEEWRKRVERWKDSGLTAKQFAADMGINAGTLQFWSCKLKRGDRKVRKSRLLTTLAAASLVEIQSTTGAARDTSFEIELVNGRRVRVGAGFVPEALKMLLAVVEAA
jgi:transposase-like protein